MNIYDHIVTYNKDEIRLASEWIDRIDRRNRNRAMIGFGLRCLAVLAFGLLMAYTIDGWLCS